MINQTCTNCGTEQPWQPKRQWWHLNGYFHVSGFFCPDCYRLVAHTSDQQPENPEAWAAIAVKQRLERAKGR